MAIEIETSDLGRVDDGFRVLLRVESVKDGVAALHVERITARPGPRKLISSERAAVRAARAAGADRAALATSYGVSIQTIDRVLKSAG